MYYKIFIYFFSLLYIFSCSLNERKEKSIHSINIKNVLTKYCVNYNDVDNYSIHVTKTSIFEEMIRYYLTNNRKQINVKSYKIDFLKEGIETRLLPAKIINKKIQIFSKPKNIFMTKDDFFKKLWLISIKKEVKREILNGEVLIYYQVYDYYLNNNGEKIYSKIYTDTFYEKSINKKIDFFLKKYMNFYIEEKVKEKLIKIAENLIDELHLSKKSSIITQSSNKEFWSILIKNVKYKIKIVFFIKNDRIINIIPITKIFYDFSDLTKYYHNDFNKNLNCKEKNE